MKALLLIASGFLFALVLLLSCGQPLTEALGQDAGVKEPINITSRFIWVTRTYDCGETSQIGGDPGDVGYAWMEMDADQVRAIHVLRKMPDGRSFYENPDLQLVDGFVRYETTCYGGDQFIITLGLEQPEQ